MKNPAHLLRLALPLALAAGSLSAQTLLNDTFADTNRSNQSLTASSAWYLRSFGTTTLSASTGALRFTQNATPVTTNILTYFTDSGSRTIADGETITVSFTMTVSNANANAGSLRLGLFNSGGTRINTDSTANFTDSAFNNYTGYSNGFSTGVTATNYLINERTGANTALFAAANNPQRNTNPNNVAIGATANTPFDVSFSIGRTGSSYLITSTVNGQTATFTDTTISATAFDTFALQFSTGAVSGDGTITLDNINIGVTAIPEPSSLAALAGLGVLGLAATRRRRRAA